MSSFHESLFLSYRCRITVLALFLALALQDIAAADEAADASRRENQFKAAYLFNFIKFVEWPATERSDVLTVCFLGGEGVYGAFTSDIDSKRIGEHRLQARMIDTPTPATGCNAIYLDDTAAHKFAGTLRANATPILTIGDSSDFAKNGGMIELFTAGNRLRFNVNIAQAQHAGLRISSSLLQLAASVERSAK